MKPNFFTKETILDFNTKDRGFPEFIVGDTIEVAQKIVEGEKERIQMFKGDVIGFHRKGISTTFTVRRLSADGIFVEKIFPYYSTMINDIKVIKRGNVRRAKLYYLRDKIGKGAKIKEKILGKKQKEEKNIKIEKIDIPLEKSTKKESVE